MLAEKRFSIPPSNEEPIDKQKEFVTEEWRCVKQCVKSDRKQAYPETVIPSDHHP
jgi:hypothetical protein